MLNRALIDLQKGETKAQACANACSHQLIVGVALHWGCALSYEVYEYRVAGSSASS
jgi:hypothetical protein